MTVQWRDAAQTECGGGGHCGKRWQEVARATCLAARARLSQQLNRTRVHANTQSSSLIAARVRRATNLLRAPRAEPARAKGELALPRRRRQRR